MKFGSERRKEGKEETGNIKVTFISIIQITAIKAHLKRWVPNVELELRRAGRCQLRFGKDGWGAQFLCECVCVFVWGRDTLITRLHWLTVTPPTELCWCLQSVCPAASPWKAPFLLLSYCWGKGQGWPYWIFFSVSAYPIEDQEYVSPSQFSPTFLPCLWHSATNSKLKGLKSFISKNHKEMSLNSRARSSLA